MDLFYETIGFLVFWMTVLVLGCWFGLVAVGIWRDRAHIRWPWQHKEP